MEKLSVYKFDTVVTDAIPRLVPSRETIFVTISQYSEKIVDDGLTGSLSSWVFLSTVES